MNNEQKGTWEKRYRYANLWCFRCSLCKKTSTHSQCEVPQYPYCPNCGKPMKIFSEVNNAKM